MAPIDPKATVWPAEPHTLAKHAILTNYLDAWMPILAAQARKVGATNRPIRFIDAFAGPGIYSEGEKGSPILAVETALEHSLRFPTPIHFLFIEKNPQRFESLEAQIASIQARALESSNVVIEPAAQGDCRPILHNLLADCDTTGQPFGPALVFLDQFGYSSIPMDLIRQILQHDLCEVITYLDFSGMNRFFEDEDKAGARDEAFGSNVWRNALCLKGSSRTQALLSLYKTALKSYGGADFVWDFAMCDSGGRLIYWLFFCTRNIRGLEEMKKAMWRVDETGTFRFSDQCDPDQLALLTAFDDDWLARHLMAKFAGKRPEIREVRDYVMTQTPCYKWASVLRRLRSSKRVDVDSGVAFLRDLDSLVHFSGPTLFD